MPKRIMGALVVLACLSPAARASVVVAMGLSDLVANAEVVVEGRVLETRVERDARGSLATRVVLQTGEVFKAARPGTPAGSAPPAQPGRFEFLLPGGELDGVGLVIPGLPRVRAGERLVLLLTVESSRGIRMPVGMQQGVFRLSTVDGSLRATRDAGGSFVARDGKPAVAPALPSDYGQLAAQLRRHVAEEARR